MEVNTDLSEVDIIVNDLQEQLFTENEEFYEEWRKNNMHYKQGDTLTNSIAKLRRDHDIPDENILDFLLKTTEALNLHIDLGSTKVSSKIEEFKERLLSQLRRLRQKQYEQEHFVGRTKDIDKIKNTLSEFEYKGVCICGLGGNGKTELADYVCKEYEKLNWDCRKVVAREVKTVSQLARSILNALERTEIMTDNKTQLQKAVYDCLVTDTRFHKENILFIDNIDDVHNEWADLLDFLQSLMAVINNHRSIKTRLLITSRKKLLKEGGIYNNLYSLFQRQPSVTRFDEVCLEIELQPLDYDSASKLVRSALPREIQIKVSSDDIKKLIVASGHNPLLIHTLCDTLKHGGKGMNEILKHSWSIMTAVTGQLKPDACLEQSFQQLPTDSQELLIQLAVFKTSPFESKHIRTITKSCSYGETLPVEFCRLKVYHLIELRDFDGKEFSIHPLVYNFLKYKIQNEKRDLKKLYTEAVMKFIHITIAKMEEFDSLHQRSINRVQSSFVRNEAHFHILLEHLKENPSNDSRSIKQNKIISETADLIISDKNKIELMKILRDKADEEKECLVAFFWKIEIIEAHLDNDDKSGLEKLINLGQSLKRVAHKHSPSSLMPVFAMLMYLKGKWYYRYDRFQEGFESLYTALCVLQSDLQSRHLVLDASFKGHKEFRNIRSNVFNLIGCLYQRETGTEDDIAIHCFVEAFHSMIRCTNRKRSVVRSSNMALYISNIGACIYSKGIELLKTDTSDNGRTNAISLFTEALKWSRAAIKLRQQMGQEKFSTYAFELQKEGKCFLELQKSKIEMNKPSMDQHFSEPKLYYLALDDFKAALEIHLRIEKFPHSNITLVLHLIAKTGVLIGREQISRGVTDAGEDSLKYSKLLYDKIAMLVYDNGLEGYDRELRDIKQNHMWLLEHLKDEKLHHVKKVYEDCESGKRKSIWERNSTKITKIAVEDRLKNLEKLLSKDDVCKNMDFSTKEKVEKLISTVESQSDTLTSEELSTLLPITFPDMDTDNGSTTSDDIFKTIEIEALSENHRSEIDKMQNVLEQRSCESNDFKLALECIKLCKDEEHSKQVESAPQKVAFKRGRSQSMADEDPNQEGCSETKF